MSYSKNEQISHVARRLGFGTEPTIVNSSGSTDDAIAAALDLSTPTPSPTDLTVPKDSEDARSPENQRAPYVYWFDKMLNGPRRIEERLTWFWHDHFPSSMGKVRYPYLLYVQHTTLRKHATGNFADMLYAMATDPAMLMYLDGVQNRSGSINENFGREVMELFTLGIGNYTEKDVLAASSAFSGWVVAGERTEEKGIEAEIGSAVFVPRLHDDSTTTLLGVTGRHDARSAVDILLDQPATAERISLKLYRELVGLSPDDATLKRIAATFRKDYSIMALVEAIIAEPGFLSDEAIRSKVRTPLERTIGVAQAFELDVAIADESPVIQILRNLSYVPFNPPSVAGYPKGMRLLGPFDLAHGFDIAWLIPKDLPDLSTDEVAALLGLHDLTNETRAVLDRTPDSASRTMLALNSPEYLLT